MLTKSLISTIAILGLFLAQFLHAKTQNNIDIIVQDNNVNVTRNEVILMIKDMNWKQRQKVLSDENILKGLLIDLVTQKKLANEAQKKDLDKTELFQWKANKATKQLLAKELITDFKASIIPPDNFEALAYDNYIAHPEKYKIQEQIKASHILFLAKEKGTTETHQKQLELANKTLKEIQEGLAFKDAAIKYSDDKGTATNGGKLPNFFTRGAMVPPFENAAFALKNKGDISDVIKTQFGYHIIQLDDRKNESIKPFSEVKNILIEKYTNDFYKNETAKYMKSFGANKDTVVFLPALQLVFNHAKEQLSNSK